MSLPTLTHLSPSKCSSVNMKVIAAAWREATARDRSPDTMSWSSFRASDKRTLVHDVAKASQDADRQYRTPYLQVDIDTLLDEDRYSVEHVVPRSRCHDAEGDVWNFVEADRYENSRRSNLPLMLWPDLHSRICKLRPGDLCTKHMATHNDERHYVPPLAQRARLARKWLYTRATYNCLEMSKAQRENLGNIIALCKRSPPSETELAVARILEAETGTRNPLLLDEDPSRWYECSAWRALVADGRGAAELCR